jgi:glycosyltransferase involved in cell wall biosynthesis
MSSQLQECPIITCDRMKSPSSQNAKPRICLLTESYYPIIGGGETQSRITAEDLIVRGFEVMVITRQSDISLKTFEKMGDIRIYRVPPQGKGHLKRWLMMAPLMALLIKHRHEFDIVLVSGYRAIGIVAVLISQLFHKACVLKADNNGEMSGEFFAGGLTKWNLELSSWPVRKILSLRNGLFKKADAFVSISSEITAEVSRAGISANKICAIPNSVDTHRFYPVSEEEKAKIRQQLNLPLGDRIVVYTGRLMTTKGLPLLIKVWKEVQLSYPEAKLLIVGGGSKDIHDCEAYLQSYIATHQLEASVILTGNVKNVDEYLKASDVFVFPTEDEAFGISMIEAMACGLPAIATSVGGLKDIVTPGENGLLFEAGNFDQLKAAITSVMNDLPKAQALGQAALNTVQERYTRNAVADKYVELLTKISQQ